MKNIILKAIAILNKPEKSKLRKLIVLHTLVSIADIASLALLLALIAFYTQPGNTENMSRFYAPIQYLQNIHFLLPLFLFLILFVFKNFAAYAVVRMQYSFIYNVASRISKNNMSAYLDGAYKDYVHIDSSVHISTISYKPMEFSTYILAGLQQMFTEGILTLAAVIAILFFNAKLFLLLLIILLPPVFMAAFFSKRSLKTARESVKESVEKSTQHLHEALAGYIEGNVFGKKDFFINRYAKSQQKLSAALSQLQITQAIPSRFIEVFAVAGLLLLIMVNKYAGNTTTEIINIGAFMAAAYKIIPGITRIANISSQIRVFQHTIHKTGSMPDPRTGFYNTVTEKIESIIFQQVSFSYLKETILQHFNLEIKRGDFIGISAASGKGKTTIINLFLGFLTPDEGHIYINNNIVSDRQESAYWKDIAYVKQQIFLINDTILRNIILSDDDYDVQRLEQAIMMSGLREFISSFEEGYHKIISDSGKNISGGQRQRIALARAFYKDAGVLLLDEPFSELDSVSEHLLLRHLKELSENGKIILLITHNKEGLQFCTKTVTINE